MKRILQNKSNIYGGFAKAASVISTALDPALTSWNKLLLWSTVANTGISLFGSLFNLIGSAIHKPQIRKIDKSKVFTKPSQSTTLYRVY